MLPAFRERTGIVVGYTAVGTGLALNLAEQGEADALITHDAAREQAFVEAGHAFGRRVFASSDFVVVGPGTDPGGVRGTDAREAFRRIAETGVLFASRGDSSGTHARELLLWREAGATPRADSAYVEVRAGMWTTLHFADERGAYTLTDRATYLAHRDRLRLRPLVSGDPLLENPYAFLIVNPTRHPGADARRAGILSDWLRSDEARGIILGLERGGEALFRVPETDTALVADATDGPTRLTVSAAVSLREGLEEVAGFFEAGAAGADVQLNLGATGDLQRQIEAGVPADVFVSAASGMMDVLERRGAIDPDTRRDVACNRLVVATADAARVPSRLEDLLDVDRVAIGSPETVPAGQYARQALEASRLWAPLQPKLVFAGNVRAVLQYVARGEVDAGFVYRTDVAAEPSTRIAFVVDAGLHEPIVYSAAVVSGAPSRGLAGRFLDALAGPPGRAALERRGFGVPPCAVPVAAG